MCSTGRPIGFLRGKIGFTGERKDLTIRPRHQESAKLLILDGCVFRDDFPKCDGMFFYEKGNKIFMILVELKGGDIDHAFEQVKYTRETRSEYFSLKNQVMNNRAGRPIELAFVVSNHRIDRVRHQKLENMYQVRVKAVLHSEATTPLSDLREWI